VIKIPDGKYIMDADLWRTTEQGNIKRLFGSQVRVTIEGGSLKDWKVCISDGWYKETTKGISLSEGHTFVDTVDDLKALCNGLPFSWRE